MREKKRYIQCPAHFLCGFFWIWPEVVQPSMSQLKAKKGEEKKNQVSSLIPPSVDKDLWASARSQPGTVISREKERGSAPEGCFVQDIPPSWGQTWTLKLVEFWIFYSTMQAIRQPLIKKAERKISIWKALKRNVHGFTLSVNLLGFISKESFWWKSLSSFIFIYGFFSTTVLIFFPFTPAIRD